MDPLPTSTDSSALDRRARNGLQAGIVSAVAGPCAWGLAMFADHYAIGLFPLPLVGMGLPLLAGGWTFHLLRGMEGRRVTIARALAVLGFLMGGFWVVGVGILFLIWPH
jgi:hypothetical protein